MAMSTGKVVALIQAMGGADPAVIESAVQDWLDAHPEATTTVQDGSITEQKLATTVAQKLGLISSLSDEIDSIQIEGYTKSEYADVTHEASIYAGQYVEIQNGKIKISTSSGYQYARINVTPGKTYRTTGLCAFSGIRPAMYTDADGNILLRFPTSTPSSPSHTTVETTAPVNAVYLYVSEYSSYQITIESKGIYYLESETVPQIDVVINRNGYPDVTITTHQNGDIRQTVEVFNGTEQPNNAVLPRAVLVYADGAWKTVVNNEDDNCPVEISSGYIGAGHGYSRAYKLTLSGHGKTFADIGSKWINDSQYVRYYYIVRIIDENNLIVLGNNLTENEYDTTGWFGGATLTHVEGAVHTDAMTGFTRAQYLLTPLDKNHTKKILLDGIIPVSSDGEYKANEFVDIVDEYDIVNPQDIVQQIITNKPSGGYTENPEINTGDTFLHFSNLYRVLADGTMLLFTTIDNSLNITLGHWGGTQYAQKSPANAFGGALFRYVPKVLPIDSHEFRIPFNMANWNFTASATTEYWEDANNPPDRLLHLFTDGNGKYAAGFAVGYLPIAEGAASVRKDNIGNAMYLYNTKKAYFHLVDSGGTNGNSWTAFKPFQCVCYRKPVIDVADVHTDAYFVPLGEKCYMYADYHAVADDRIKVPAEYVGKPMTVVEKSSNVTVYGTVATDEIRIRCATADPMYGYAVIQIG